jgi:hypothetical protein
MRQAIVIPAPRAPGRPPKYPLRSLAVGESVFIPGTTHRKINQVRPCYRPMKFKCRSVVSGGIPGVRVWRIA